MWENALPDGRMVTSGRDNERKVLGGGAGSVDTSRWATTLSLSDLAPPGPTHTTSAPLTLFPDFILKSLRIYHNPIYPLITISNI